MSKKSSKRAKRRAAQYPLPDVRRDYLMHLERRGKLQTTPREWQVSDREGWYLSQLSLTRRLWHEELPYQPPPIIRTRELVPINCP